MTSATVVLLRSPRTGRELSALDGDRVYACSEDRVAYELVGSELVERPYLLMPPARTIEGRRFWLPFWRFRFQVEISGSGAGAGNLRTVFDTRPAYVRAFSLANAQYIGDPSFALTIEDAPEPVENPQVPPCFGARLDSNEAAQLGKMYLVDLADRTVDVSGLDVGVIGDERSLVMVPYAEVGPELHMLSMESKLPKDALRDFSSIEERCHPGSSAGGESNSR